MGEGDTQLSISLLKQPTSLCDYSLTGQFVDFISEVEMTEICSWAVTGKRQRGCSQFAGHEARIEDANPALVHRGQTVDIANIKQHYVFVGRSPG